MCLLHVSKTSFSTSVRPRDRTTRTGVVLSTRYGLPHGLRTGRRAVVAAVVGVARGRGEVVGGTLRRSGGVGEA